MDPSYATKLLGYNKHTSHPDLRPNPFEQNPSYRRAMIAAMNHDTISAGLWALSAFDPALVHLAELRERFNHLDEEDPLRATLDRLTSVYMEGQCRELLHGAGITTRDADVLITEAFGVIDDVSFHVLACTEDPLAMEIFGYALYLGALTSHGMAPWRRFAATMADCYYKLHPRLQPV